MTNKMDLDSEDFEDSGVIFSETEDEGSCSLSDQLHLDSTLQILSTTGPLKTTKNDCTKNMENRSSGTAGKLCFDPYKNSQQCQLPHKSMRRNSSLPLLPGIQEDLDIVVKVFLPHKINHNMENQIVPKDVKTKLSLEQEYQYTVQSKTKDGGYGWIIVIGAFLVNVIIDGIVLSFGIFYSEWLVQFNEGQSKTAWIGSVLSGTYSLLGPISSGLSNKFGCRIVCITGSLISTTAFLMSVFSPSVDVLIIVYGFIGGLGFSLMYIPAIVTVSFYFDERRALATGIAVCGSGIGTFIFAPLTEYLCAEYGWKGSLVIIAGIVLHGAVAGALFKPYSGDDSKSSESHSNSNLSHDSIGSSIHPKDLKTTPSKEKDYMQIHSSPFLSAHHQSARKDKKTLIQKFQFPVTDWEMNSRSLDNIHFSYRLDPITSRYSMGFKESSVSKHILTGSLYRSDVFYSGSVYQVTATGYDEDVQSKDVLCSPALRPSLISKKSIGALRRALDILAEMTNFSLFADLWFSLYTFSCALTMFGFMVPFIYLPNCVNEAGLSKRESALLLSVLGLANTIGRVLCGWAADQRRICPVLINCTALMVTGTMTFIIPQSNNFIVLSLIAYAFGTGVAVFISLRSIIMVELIGLTKLTNGFGLLSMCQGIALIIGPPVAGILWETTNNYKVAFIIAGAAIFSAGLFCLPLYYHVKKKK